MLRVTLAGLVSILVLVFSENVMAVEEAKYNVIYSKDGLELRSYEPHILAETMVDGTFESAGNKAFDRLFKYISGNNKQQLKVAMTSPVGQEASSQKVAMTTPVSQQKMGEKWVVSFMMPNSFTLEATPEPKDKSISIRQVPARVMAAIRYSGSWDEKNYRNHLIKLQSWVVNKPLTPIGEPILARYNSPLMPWFLRRNEILIPVIDSKNSAIDFGVITQ